MKALNAAELFTKKWLILCYVNFTSIKKKKKLLEKRVYLLGLDSFFPEYFTRKIK